MEIRNFRSIQHLIINTNLNDLNVFVGKNDIGKSNILRALNLFFNNETDLGKKLNFNRAELDEWLMRNRNTTTEEAAQQAADYPIKMG